MQTSRYAVIQECEQGAFAGRLTFPQVVERLSALGVERYYTDLIRLEKTYYFEDGETVTDHLPLNTPPPINARFSAAAVPQALRALQQGEIDYPVFLRQIMSAGTASYIVFFKGRQTIYFGRHGEHYIEHFPGSK